MSSEMDRVSRAEFEALKAELAALKLSRLQKTFRAAQRNKRTILAGVIMGLVIPMTISALSITKTHTFTAGNPTVASEINTNFDQLFTKVNDLAAYHPPVGSIIAWHKDMLGPTPGLPLSGEWVECNGQMLNDTGSPYHTRVIPNLNGYGGGADSPDMGAKVRMFLRGNTISGAGELDSFQGHYHNRLTNNVTGINGSGPWTFTSGSSAGTVVDVTVTEPTNDGSHGTPRTANETRPVNMSVVWIMKVK